MQRNLLHGLAVYKHHSPSVEIWRHIGLVIFNEQPIMKDVDGTEGVVAP